MTSGVVGGEGHTFYRVYWLCFHHDGHWAKRGMLLITVDMKPMHKCCCWSQWNRSQCVTSYVVGHRVTGLCHQTLCPSRSKPFQYWVDPTAILASLGRSCSRFSLENWQIASLTEVHISSDTKTVTHYCCCWVPLLGVQKWRPTSGLSRTAACHFEVERRETLEEKLWKL